MIYIFLALTILGFTFYFKRNVFIQQFFYALLILSTLFLIKNELSPENQFYQLLGVIGTVLFANIFCSRFLKNKILRWMLPLVSILTLYLFAPTDLYYGIYIISFKSVPVLILLLSGFIIGVFMEAKEWTARNFLFQLQTLRFGRALIGCVIGILTIGATFFSGYFGFIYIAIGLFLYLVYHKQRVGHFIPALLAITAASHFMSAFGLESLDLMHGKVLAGLILGACLYLMGDVSSRIFNPFIGIALFFFGVGLILMISMLNFVHPFYGGPESFIAGMFGYTIASFLIGNAQISSVAYPLLVLIGLTVPANIEESVVIDSIQQNTSSTEIKKAMTFDDYENVSWDDLKGKYEIDPASSITFELGPKGGVTKGAIKNVSGSIDFTGESPIFNVEMKVKDLTTFNTMQYESLMGDEYFNEPKYPLMVFKSNKIAQTNKEIELIGNFKMRGKTNNEIVKIKYLGTMDGVPHFVGQSIIDRPKYGFKSSPQEGDIVTFNFLLQLKKE